MAKNREHLPRPAPDVIEDGVPAVDEVPAHLLLTGDVGEGPVPPLDHAQAVDDWGVTAAEQRHGEPLDIRLRRENPDVVRADYDEDVRRLYQPGAELSVDTEPDEVGELDALWEDTLSAEEAAVHIRERPPRGVTFDEGPDYLR